MKKINLTICAASFLLFACSDKKKTDEGNKEKGTETTGTMMKNWQEYMTPGDMHKMLAKSDGEWNGDVTMWMYPGAPEQKSKSSSSNKMIMNGLYQEANHSGDMMGMPFSGKSIVGFDNHLKEFVSTWIDNMGSGVMVMKGPWDDATKTINLKGKMIDPGTKAETAVKETFKIVDDNNQEMEMFVMMPDGKEFKTMNIKYTRKK
jgi:hypothetical protein